VSPNGVLGDPSGADAAEGRRLLDRAVDDLVSCIDTLQRMATTGGRRA
jgi:creatinine amidohydrolase/Fe(II)-dependent formamide hydrolase-like protein